MTTTHSDYCYRCGIPIEGWEPIFDGEIVICNDCDEALARRYVDEVADIDDGIDTDIPWLASERAASILTWTALGWGAFLAFWVLYKTITATL